MVWVMGQDSEPLFWVPVEHRKDVYVLPCRVVIEAPLMSTISNSRFSRKWMECIDKEWLKELEQQEKEVGNFFWSRKPRCALSSVEVFEAFK